MFDLNANLQVIPVNQAGAPIGEIPFSRTGLLGFVGPVSMHEENESLRRMKLARLVFPC